MEICKQIPIEIDFQRLLDEALAIIDEASWTNDQISFQYSEHESWSADVDYYGYTRREDLCTNWNSRLEGSYIKTIIEQIHKPVASARLMRLGRLSCYTTHVDFYTRYQIPLILDPLKSFMVWPEHKLVCPLKPGNAYYCNTHEIHNYINGEHEDRINIIFNDANELPYLDNPHLSRLYNKDEINWK
jgi:hypothetical protein